MEFLKKKYSIVKFTITFYIKRSNEKKSSRVVIVFIIIDCTVHLSNSYYYEFYSKNDNVIIILWLAGLVPGPIIFGILFDRTCILWQDKCQQRGSCWIYDSYRLSLSLFLFCFCIKISSSFFFAMAHFLYSPPPEEKIASYEANGGLTIETPDGVTSASKVEYNINPAGINVESREGTNQTRLWRDERYCFFWYNE